MSTQRGQAAARAPQRTKAVVLGCTVPSSSRKLIPHLGCQMRYQLLALAFQPGVGLWGPGQPESGLDMLASSSLQGRHGAPSFHWA